MTAFLDGLKRALNATFTENGDVAHASTLDPVVDFFGLAGAMRDRPEDAAALFLKAYADDPQAAVRVMFYLRDVRGGQGERDVFRACLSALFDYDRDAFGEIVGWVPEFGRWDDLFATGEFIPAEVSDMIAAQWDDDVASYEADKPVSLMAKWLPSDKGSKVDLAIQLRTTLGLTQREYRQTLSALRERIGLLETAMSAKDYSGVDYSTVPGQALRKHVKAFYRNDQEGYEKFLSAVEAGDAGIKTGTVYPYEVFDMVKNGEQRTAEAVWKNLPDYTRPGEDAIVLADVSGSMWGRPISVSVSLALYFAERNTGPYKGYFMTFSSVPKLVKVPDGASLKDALYNIEHSTHWCGSTNLQAAFEAILSAGIRSGSVPKTLYIVSDMQFDQALNNADLSTFEVAKRRFAQHGLEIPHVVFWNVNARSDQFPATIFDGNVTLISGLSPTVFSIAVEGKSARQVVDDVINSDRYNQIVL